MKRLEVVLDGNVAELREGYELELELYNPMRQYESLLTSRALGIELLDSTPNLELIQFANEPHAAVTTEKAMYVTEIYASGNLVEEGYSYVRDAVDKLTLDFTPNLSRLFGAYQTILLSELIDLGTLPEPASVSSTVGNTWQSGGFVFPQIKNPAYYAQDQPGGWDEKMNSWNGSAYVTDTPAVPMFFLKYVLKKVGDLAGVTFTGDWWTDARTDKLLLFNTAELFPGILGDFEIRRHLTDVTLPELLMNLKRFLNLGISPDATRRSIRIDFNEPKLKAAAAVDWSDRFPAIKRGLPILTDGILFKTETDSNDGTNKDAFFAAYRFGASALNAGSEMSSKCSTLLDDTGLYCEMAGVRDGQTDKKFGLRLISWNGSPDTATNTYGTAVMNWAGLYDAFWKCEDGMRRNSFGSEPDAALTVADIAWLSDIFKGRIADVPKVHIYGVDYLVDWVVVPLGKKYMSRVGLLRN
jgi:hypothetical protein